MALGLKLCLSNSNVKMYPLRGSRDTDSTSGFDARRTQTGLEHEVVVARFEKDLARFDIERLMARLRWAKQEPDDGILSNLELTTIVQFEVCASFMRGSQRIPQRKRDSDGNEIPSLGARGFGTLHIASLFCEYRNGLIATTARNAHEAKDR
jgi:hypothetical protein